MRGRRCCGKSRAVGSIELLRTLKHCTALICLGAAFALPPLHGLASPSTAAKPLRIQVYESDARSFHANAHWVESERGLVLIDTLLLKSEAKKLVERMKASGKPLLAILITHPHVDHFSGTAVVRNHFGPVPVCATRATAEAIPRALAKAQAQGWLKPLGDDHDPAVVLPDCELAPGKEARFADMVFAVQDLGAMEADNNTVFHLPAARALFGGDAMVANAVYYVGDGRSQKALVGLESLAKRFAADTEVYSGHYGPMTLGPLIRDNTLQLERMQAVMASVRSEPGALTEAGMLTAAARARAQQQLVGAMERREGYGMDPRIIATMNMQGLMREWREQVKASATPASSAGSLP